MPFYQLTTVGEYYGQEVVNVHWYRSITAYGAFLDRIAVCQALAAEYIENIWNSRAPAYVGGYGLRDLMSDEFTFQELRVQAWDDSIVAFTSDPVIVPMGQTGLVSGGTNGSAPCAIFHANLAPAAGPGIGLPKRGYLAIGPIMDAYIGADSQLNAFAMEHFQEVADRLSLSMFTELPPDELEPIRVRLTRVAGVVTDIGYKNVSSWVVQPLAKFRRSRLPEA